MKTKEEILKMSKEELQDYKWNDDLSVKEEKDTNIYCSDCSDCFRCSDCSYCYDCYNCSNCFNCSHCSDCFRCSHCSHCSDCFRCSDCSYCYDCYNCSNCFNCLYCRNLKDKEDKYYICNIEVSKEEFEKKKKEIGGMK